MINRFSKFGVVVGLIISFLCPNVSRADQKLSSEKSSTVSFIAKITGGTFGVKSKEVSGYVVLDDAETKIVSAEIVVPVKSLDSSMDSRNNHMQNKYLEADKFPTITFSVKDPGVELSKGKSTQVSGEMSIKDVKKNITIDADIKRLSNSKLEIKSDFPINITDYGIEQPKFAVVKMDTIVKLHVDLTFEQKP